MVTESCSLLRFAALALALAGTPSAFAAPALADGTCTDVSCLQAKDINGIRLDMSIAEVAEFFPGGLEYIGGDQFEAGLNSFEYNFGFSPLGRLYRIDSIQHLGDFVPDKVFVEDLSQRLTEKYGPPHRNQLPLGPVDWTYYGNLLEPTGQVLPRRIASLDVLLGGYHGQTVTLEMKLIDFRILWRDEAAINTEPREAAQDRIQF